MTGRRLRRVLAGLLAAGASASGAFAQQPTGSATNANPRLTSGYLAGEHWAVQAMWRAEEMGLVKGLLPAQRLVPLTTVEAALREAAAAARGQRAGWGPVVQAWYDRFTQEFPGIQEANSSPRDGPVRLALASASAGYLRHTGRAAPGMGQFLPDRTGALPLPALRGIAGSATASLSLGSHLAFEAATAIDVRRGVLPVAEAVGAWGPWQVAAGRQAVGYAWAGQGGLVLSGTAPLDRVEISTRRPLVLPSLLHPLGRASVHGFLGRMPEARHPGRPYFWGARLAVQPQARISVAIQRAGLFGGNPELPITAGRIARMLVGGVGSAGFEDQIVSVDARYRLPTDRFLPLTASVEWGAEDGAGALVDEPGLVYGLHAPALPAAPWLSLGLEYARIAGHCCGNPPWYRHFAFPGSWAQGDRPLGLPLGGAGWERRVDAHADLRDSSLRLDAHAFERVRFPENLFVPGREGRSTGFGLEGSWRLAPGSEAYFSGARENGEGWRETALDLGGRVFIGY
jgi:hypothetical protein